MRPVLVAALALFVVATICGQEKAAQLPTSMFTMTF